MDVIYWSAPRQTNLTCEVKRIIRKTAKTKPGHQTVPSSTPRPVVLQAFCPPPFRDADQQKLNCMCPVRALDAYVHQAARWRKSDQLFVCYGPPKRGLPASKQTLSRWIVDAICSAYEASDLPPPLGVRAHSTRSMAASKAFLAGVPMQDISHPRQGLGSGLIAHVGISFPKRFDAARVPEGVGVRLSEIGKYGAHYGITNHDRLMKT
ncbi:SET domain-containing protein 4 [Labeo rohita]|uniref:SET domain-containing protein 4 n=1 Tax=Labeo rohita TaxID=84645 RepID=A0ABQ8M8W3_LABRO|nr:SET domain-containing protein 4 [Labeo rohita]